MVHDYAKAVVAQTTGNSYSDDDPVWIRQQGYCWKARVGMNLTSTRTTRAPRGALTDDPMAIVPLAVSNSTDRLGCVCQLVISTTGGNKNAC